MGVVIAVARCSVFEWWLKPSGGVTEHRLKHDSRAVFEFADHLVAGNKRETDVFVEVRGGMPLDERQI